MLFFRRNEKTFSYAVSLFAKKRYRQVIKVCNLILDKNPDKLNVMNLLGEATFLSGNKDETINIYDQLLRKYETGSFFDKAVAVAKKILREYPEKREYEEKLATLYGHKDLLSEQVSILIKLLKDEKGSSENSREILEKIAIIEPVISSDAVLLVKTMQKFGTEEDIKKEVIKGLELPFINKKDLPFLFELAIKLSVSTKVFIRHIPEYLKLKPNKFEQLEAVLLKYFERNFNELFFKTLISSIPEEEVLPFLMQLRKNNSSIQVWEELFYQIYKTNNISIIEKYMSKIAEGTLDEELASTCFKHFDSVISAEVMEAFALISSKINNKEYLIKSLDKLHGLYLALGDVKNAERVEGLLKNETDNKESEFIDISSFETTDDPELNKMLEYSLMSSTPGEASLDEPSDNVHGLDTNDSSADNINDDLAKQVTPEFEFNQFINTSSSVDGKLVDIDKLEKHKSKLAKEDFAIDEFLSSESSSLDKEFNVNQFADDNHFESTVADMLEAGVQPDFFIDEKTEIDKKSEQLIKNSQKQKLKPKVEDLEKSSQRKQVNKKAVDAKKKATLEAEKIVPSEPVVVDDEQVSVNDKKVDITKIENSIENEVATGFESEKEPEPDIESMESKKAKYKMLHVNEELDDEIFGEIDIEPDPVELKPFVNHISLADDAETEEQEIEAGAIVIDDKPFNLEDYGIVFDDVSVKKKTDKKKSDEVLGGGTK